MKKNYVKPSMAVIELNYPCMLLTGSDTKLPDNYEKIPVTDEEITPA